MKTKCTLLALMLVSRAVLAATGVRMQHKINMRGG